MRAVLKHAGQRSGLRFTWLMGAGAFLAFAVGLLFFSGSGFDDRKQTASSGQPTGQELQNQSTAANDPEARSTPVQDSAEGLLAGTVRDGSLSFRERRQAVLDLAQIGSERAISVLASALTNRNPPVLVSTIAEALAKSGSPGALAALREALTHADETVAGAAIRALAAKGAASDAERLQEILFDEQTPEGVRAEAALGLGSMAGPEALDALARAATQIKDDSLREDIWRGLGQRRFAETESVYQAYLNDPNIASEAKASALEALSASSGDVAPFVMNFLGDTDPSIRLAAASTLVTTEMSSEQVQRLMHFIAGETLPAVRSRLYDALAMQDGLDPTHLLQTAQAEEDPGARLSLYSLIAATSTEKPNAELLAYFNQRAVPELIEKSMGGLPYQQRLNSIITLGRAGTPEAIRALEKIASSLEDPKLQETARTAANLRRP